MKHGRSRFWSVRQAGWVKPLVALSVPIGGLFAALSFFGAVSSANKEVSPSALAMTAALFTVYLVYLFILATIEVLGRPIERYAGPGLLVFGLTIVAYIFMAAKLIDESYKGLTWIALTSSYLVSAIHHFREMAIVEDRAEQFRQGLWTATDVALFGLLANATGRYLLGHESSLVDPVFGGLTIKDIAIMVSLVVYLTFRGLPDYVLAARSASDYRDLLESSRSVRMIAGPRVPSIRGRLAAMSTVRVLDFASASSVRSVELLASTAFMNLTAAAIHWRAFDIDPAFRDDIHSLPGLASAQFTDSLGDAIEWAKSSDVLILSHSLYSLDLLDGAIALATALPAGAIVLVRGIGPSSVFSAPFEIWGSDPWRPAVAHLWNAASLDELRSQASLSPVRDGSVPPRGRWNLDALVAMVEHSYVASFKSRQGFVSALGRMYGPRMSEAFEDQFVLLESVNMTLGCRELLPSCDLVYAFVRDRATGDSSAVVAAEN